MALHKHQFVVDDSGEKTAVILDIEEYEELIDEVEELDALRATGQEVLPRDDRARPKPSA